MKSFNLVLEENEVLVIRTLLLKAPAALEMTLPVLQAIDSQLNSQIDKQEDAGKKGSVKGK